MSSCTGASAAPAAAAVASRGHAAAKRAFDVAFAGTLLTLTSPVLLAAVVAIKATSPGPVFYRARRAGRDGAPFAMLKLRTMRSDADHAGRKITAAHDDRITRVGALLRKLKVDELPQLWNVLRGDMSIVGPRPEDFDLVQRHYSPLQRRALAVRPGIACSAEVRWYPDLTWHDPPPPGVTIQDHYVQRHLPAQVAEGVRYAQRPSLATDARILAQTAWCVLVRSWWRPRRRPLTEADLRGAAPRVQETLP